MEGLPMDNGDTSRIRAEVPAEDKEMLDEILEHGELTELLREVVDAVVEGDGYDRRTVYDARLKQVKRTIRDTRDEIGRLHQELERLEETRDRLQTQRESVLTREEEWEAAFGEFERAFRAGGFGHVDDDHPRLQDLATRFGRDAEAIHDELRGRNPDIPDHAFQAAILTRNSFPGLPESRVNTPADERGDTNDAE